VEKVWQSGAKLEVFDNAASDITAAAQVVGVKLESGIVSGDLAALEPAIAKAQEVLKSISCSHIFTNVCPC
jgi:hypothetical protein